MDEKKKLLPNRYHLLADELRNIGSIDLTCKATNFLEKFLWISFGLVGIAWFVFFMIGVIEDENHLTSIREDIKLKDVNYPAITICSDSTTKYALAERLGNYINPNLDLPDKLNSLIKKFIDNIDNTTGSSKYFKNYNMECQGYSGKSVSSSACEVNYVSILSSEIKYYEINLHSPCTF